MFLCDSVITMKDSCSAVSSILETFSVVYNISLPVVSQVSFVSVMSTEMITQAKSLFVFQIIIIITMIYRIFLNKHEKF